jgi:hypothetical protein
VSPRAAITAVFFVDGALFVGPPLIGGIAQLTSLRLACGLMAMAGLLVVLLAPTAEVRAPRPTATAKPSLTT